MPPAAGERAAFQLRSLAYLWRAVPAFDVVLSQEMLRGSLNATLVGALRGVPVVTTMALPPLEYFRCRRERRQIGFFSTQHIARPIITREDGSASYDHKGFNWRVLRGLVSTEFELVRESTSPVEWLGPQLGTQRWLIARKRRAGASLGAEARSAKAAASILRAADADQERVA